MSLEDLLAPLRRAAADLAAVPDAVGEFCRLYFATDATAGLAPAVDDVLGELASDLEYFEPDAAQRRRAGGGLFDEAEAQARIRRALGQVDAYGAV